MGAGTLRVNGFAELELALSSQPAGSNCRFEADLSTW